MQNVDLYKHTYKLTVNFKIAKNAQINAVTYLPSATNFTLIRIFSFFSLVSLSFSRVPCVFGRLAEGCEFVLHVSNCALTNVILSCEVRSSYEPKRQCAQFCFRFDCSPSKLRDGPLLRDDPRYNLSS